MKFLYLILAVMLLFSAGFGQQIVRETPLLKYDPFIFGSSSDYAVLGDHADGLDTTTAFSVLGHKGVVNIWFIADTTDADSAVLNANNSDSCLTVYMQLKDDDLGWGGEYSSTLNNYSKLDTISRNKINSAGDIYLFMELANFDDWASADSARLILKIGVGDTLPAKVKVGGGSY